MANSNCSTSIRNRTNGQIEVVGDIRYRRARPDDLPAMASVFLSALPDLYARNNIMAPLPPRSTVMVDFEHVLDTGTFHVAEQNQRIVAIAGAIVRDPLWFLSAFWALPSLQGRGIGMPLLRRVWQDGRDAGASVFFTWASIDLTAMAAYMKLGMLPGAQILKFEGVPQGVESLAEGYEVLPLEPAVAMALDFIILRTQRRADHTFWRDRADRTGFQLVYRGQIAGYYYLGDGAIGPAAWTEPRHGTSLLAAAFAGSAAAPTTRLAIPGMNHDALRFALGAGLRLRGFAHFLTSARFERLGYYLPSGPALF